MQLRSNAMLADCSCRHSAELASGHDGGGAERIMAVPAPAAVAAAAGGFIMPENKCGEPQALNDTPRPSCPYSAIRQALNMPVEIDMNRGVVKTPSCFSSSVTCVRRVEGRPCNDPLPQSSATNLCNHATNNSFSTYDREVA